MDLKWVARAHWRMPRFDVRTTDVVQALTSYLFECTINSGIVYPLRGGL